MNIGISNPIDSVVKNLALASTGSNQQGTMQSTGSLANYFRPLPLPLPNIGAEQSVFNQMFGNVLQLFKTFVGTMRDLGLVNPADPTSNGTEEVGNGGSTTGTTGEVEEENPIMSVVDSILGPVKDLFGSLGEKITSFFGKAISKPSTLLNPIKNLFKKAKKLFTSKTGILSGAFKLIKSFF